VAATIVFFATVLSAVHAEEKTPAQTKTKCEQLGYIGIARMAKDGTIVMELSRTQSGITYHDTLKYKLSDLDYRSILEHIGKLNPDGTMMSVKAWCDH
jgi:hypothetical protein